MFKLMPEFMLVPCCFGIIIVPIVSIRTAATTTTTVSISLFTNSVPAMLPMYLE